MLFHHGGPVSPNTLWAAWSFETPMLLALGLTALVYMWGMWNAQRRSATRALPLRQWAAFAGAMLALVIAFLSPLDELSGDLFWAHMTQHLILMVVAAPLLVLSALPVAVLRALPRNWAQLLGRGLNRSHAWHALLSPVAAWLLFAAVMWLWHASALYQAALRNEAIHDLEHLCFILVSMLFWWVLFRHTTAEHVQYGVAIPYLFTTMLHSTILAALMTFTTRPWYAYYLPLVGKWGLTPLQDQQLAGLIMWIPGGVVFTVLTIGYFGAWLRAMERRSLRAGSGDEAHAGSRPL